MRPPIERPDDSPCAEVEETSWVPRTGRLVELLQGKGLTTETVRELLLPESATRLRTILTHHLSAQRTDRGPGARREPGKVLAYRTKGPGRDPGPAIPASSGKPGIAFARED